MEIDVTQYNDLRLKAVFSGVLLETEEGHRIGVCMRDDTVEINVMPNKKNTKNWWRVNMQTGQIEQMANQSSPIDRQTESMFSVGESREHEGSEV